MRNKLIKGTTVEEKIDSIDLILSRMRRHEKKNVFAMISPIPISAYIENVTGPVLKFMFPADGTISDILMYVEEMPKAGINVTATLHAGIGTAAKTTFSKKKVMIIDSDYGIAAGDRITVTVEKAKDEEILSGIWLSFLWTPNKSATEVRKFLIDELGELDNKEVTTAPTTGEA